MYEILFFLGPFQPFKNVFKNILKKNILSSQAVQKKVGARFGWGRKSPTPAEGRARRVCYWTAGDM